MSNQDKFPQSIKDAVDFLLSDFSLNNEIYMTAMKEEELVSLHLSFGSAIRNDLGLWTGNDALIESCRKLSGNENIHVDDASMLIIKALWKRLKETSILVDHV